MNVALFHGARPGDIGDGRDTGRMREAAAMARHMGLGDVTAGMGSQAANIWKMLDDLAVTDSKAYEELAKAGREELTKPKGRFFVPVPGFVAKTSLSVPWRPPPLPSTSDRQRATVEDRVAAGTKMFINVCSHECVAKPMDQMNNEIDETRDSRNSSGLRMPMAIGQVRETTDHSGERALAVDAVYHPWVIRCSLREKMFLQQVGDLAVRFTASDHSGLKLHAKWKQLKVLKYKGGAGKLGNEPVQFPVDEDDQNSLGHSSSSWDGSRNSGAAASGSAPGMSREPGGTSADRSILKDPQSLLAAMSKASADKDVSETVLVGGASAGNIKESAVVGNSRNPNDLATNPFPGTIGQKTDSHQNGGVQESSNAFDIRLPGSAAGLSGNSRQHPPQPPMKSANRSGGPLISEITSDADVCDESSECAEENTRRKGPGEIREKSKVGKGPPAVKKGFLNGGPGRGESGGNINMKPLYPPTGSENGSAPSAYVKLMSRCKVVDTSTSRKEEVDAAMRAHAGGPKPSQSEQSTDAKRPVSCPDTVSTKNNESAVRKGFLRSGKGGSLYGEEGSREGSSGGRLKATKIIDRDFERLMAEADPDMGDTQASTVEAIDPIGEQLAQLASLLGPTSSFPESRTNASTKTQNPPPPPTSKSKNSSGKLLREPPTAVGKYAGKKKANSIGVSVPENVPTPAPTSTIIGDYDADGVKDEEASAGVAETHEKCAGKRAIDTQSTGVVSSEVRSDAASGGPSITSTDFATKTVDEENSVTTPAMAQFGADSGVQSDRKSTTKSAVTAEEPVPESVKKAAIESIANSAEAHEPYDSLDTTLLTANSTMLQNGSTASTAGKGEVLNSTDEQKGHENTDADICGALTVGERAIRPGGGGLDGGEWMDDKPSGKATTSVREGVEREPAYRMEEIRTDQGTSVGDRNREKRRMLVTVDLPYLSRGGHYYLVKNAKAPQFELTVDTLALDLRVPGVYKLSLNMPFPVDANRVTAKFSKKKTRLTITAPEK